VFILQAALYANGYRPGTPDSIFGTLTDSAVRSFQSTNNLTIDGIAGAKTFNALLG